MSDLLSKSRTWLLTYCDVGGTSRFVPARVANRNSAARAVIALFLAVGGTAVAVYLRMRVSAAGQALGTGNDGTAVKETRGRYRITFHGDAQDGSGPRGNLDLRDCAISATPYSTSTADVLLEPNEVRVFVDKPWQISNEHLVYLRKDAAFDVVVVCFLRRGHG